MALSRDKKKDVVKEVSELLKSSKLTVVAEYKGLTVDQLQELRRAAEESNTTIKVVKNRLFKQAMLNSDLKDSDHSMLKEQLIYGFNNEDEVAGPQTFANFAKKNTDLKFVGAYSADGVVLSAEDVSSLASLPSKEQLRGQLVGTIQAPISGFVRVLAGNVRGVLNVLNARAETIK